MRLSVPLLCLARSALVFVAGIFVWFPNVGKANQGFNPEGFVDLAGLWSELQIPVCWEPSDQVFDKEKGWVRDSVHELIEKQSAISFQGWTDCRAVGGRGIRIRIADEWPRSEVGHQWVRDPKNPKRILQDQATAQFLERPTKMVLNFSFKQSFSDCAKEREHCIRAIGVHEMLHALGFLHEQLRADAPQDCKNRYKNMQDFGGYQPVEATQYYDSDSHMNYCADMYRKPIKLSKGDVQVLKKFYSKR